MPPRRSSLPASPLLHLAAASLLLLGGCERGRPPARAGSATPAAPSIVDSMALRRDQSGWNAAAGPALLAQGPARDQAIVLYPFADDSDAAVQLDSASAEGAPVILLGRGGKQFSARLGTPPAETAEDCELWPLRVSAGRGGLSAWSVGFVGGQVAPMPLDSVDVLSARDSMTLVAEATRLASSVTAPTSASFQGLRFTAHDIRRFAVSPGVQGLVAHLTRRVNQEANPQEEQTLLVAERDSGTTSGPYTLAYAERSSGREERVVTPEVIAAVRIGGMPTLVIARDNDDGVVYALLERTGTRRWRVRWKSAVTRCG